MKKNSLIVLCIAAGLMSACGLTPKHHISRSNVASSVEIKDAPVGAVLSVGGSSVVVSKEGTARIAVSDGTHELTVTDGGEVVYRETIFIQDGTRKIIDLKP